MNRGDAHILPYRPGVGKPSVHNPSNGRCALALGIDACPEPRVGRVYRSQRTIRLADVAVDGRLRFDAMARYMQDVASDDVEDAGAEDELLTWVVRRTLIDVEQPVRRRSIGLPGHVGQRLRIALGGTAHINHR